MLNKPAVYILASRRKGTLYVGVTNNLVRRIWEHRNNLAEGFTNNYSVHHLVWYKLHESTTTAITREKQLKNWKRDWKIALVVGMNPDWVDLYEEIV